MMRPLHRAAARSAIWAGLCALLASAEADAARRIVFLGFGGPRGAEATRLVSRFLAGRFDLVGAGRFAQEARRRGLSPASAAGRSLGARAVRAVAVVGGQVVRGGGLFSLRVVVYSADDGQPVGNLSYPLHGMRVDLLTARRVATGILPAVARARPGAPVAATVAVAPLRSAPRRAAAPEPAPVRPVAPRATARRHQPEFDDGSEPEDSSVYDQGPDAQSPGGEPDDPKQVPRYRSPQPRRRPAVAHNAAGGGESENLGFDVSEGNQDEPRETGEEQPRRRSKGGDTSAQVRKLSGGRAEWEKIAELSLGLILLNRSFDFNDPIQPANPRNYRSGMVPAILIDAGLYPLAFFGHNALANLGLVFSYYRVPVLRSKVDGVDTDTTLHQLELGLRYRWNILGKPSSPLLRAGLSFGQLGFEIHYDPTLYSGSTGVPLPNITYRYLKLALAQLEVPFYTKRSFAIGGLLSFDYLHVFSAGDIERTDSGGYGDSSTGGIDISGGLYTTVAGFFARVTGFYRRMFYAFDGRCFNENLGCNSAGGALDIYQGVTMVAGYAY